MYIELHIIQNFAPSNLNRDDTNNPKDCEFGGSRRARISSQCMKRAIRYSPVFAQTTAAEIGMRTKRLANTLRQPLLDAGKSEAEVDSVTVAFAAAYAGGIDKKTGRTNVLLYLSPDEVQMISAMLIENWDAVVAKATNGKSKDDPFKGLVKDLIKVTKGRTSAPDIALFGRMLAAEPNLNLDAACQVAHAISTHRVSMEMDFYTAIDDLQPQAEPGAGMMGFTGFNSACFYRYARIDWKQLLANLDNDHELARRTVAGFLRAAVTAIPSAKQNSFAAQNQPSFLLGVARTDGMSWSLANAFEKPVYPGRDSGLVAPSVKALDDYWERLTQVYGDDGLVSVAALALDEEPPLVHLKDTLVPDLNGWVQQLVGALPQEQAA